MKSPVTSEFDDVPIGSISIVPDISRFKRAFKIFTMGQLDVTDLDKSRCVVTGGAVTACLLPWYCLLESIISFELTISFMSIISF